MDGVTMPADDQPARITEARITEIRKRFDGSNPSALTSDRFVCAIIPRGDVLDLLAEITRLTAALEEARRSVEVVSASLSRCDQARADAMADRDFCLDRIWNAENVDLVSPHGFHPASTRGKLLGILARAGIVTIVKNDSECVSCRRALARAAEGE